MPNLRNIPFLCALLGFVLAQADNADDLLDLSVEQLMQIPVTTATRTEQRVRTTAAAVFVITAEDLQRTGIRSLPEALRLVPGLQVAQIEANKWAVSSRGFAGRFAYQMQVLIDGRSVYSSLFSGTAWEMLNIPIEEVERIEVIRGPGGSVWGSNAVNGVVNIITRPARTETSTRLTLGIGTQERGFGLLQQSGSLGESVAYRAYVQGFDRGEGEGRLGLDAEDDWREGRVGLRLEWDAAPRDHVAIQGDYYQGIMGQTLLVSDPTAPAQWPGSIVIPEDLRATGGYLMADWRHDLGERSSWAVRAYYQHEDREEISIDDLRRTYMLEFEHRFPAWNERHEIIWGGSYRQIRDRCRDTDIGQYSEKRQRLETFSAFVQDEIALVPNRFTLTLGARFELTDRNGWQSQPSARLAFTPSPKQTWWLAVSRAIRVPSRMEFTARRSLVQGVIDMGGTPWNYTASFLPSPDLNPEQLLAYELGTRLLLSDSLSLDIALYYHDISDAVVLEYAGSTVGPGTLDDRYMAGNSLSVSCYGVEVAAKYRPVDWWRLDLAYTFMRVQLHPDDGVVHYSDDWYEEDAPRHQISLLSSFHLTPTLDLDLWARYVDNINDVADYTLSSYVSLDASIRWRPTPNVELTLAGRNLSDSSHPEYYPSTLLTTASTEVPRSVYVQIALHF
ncbi:MAG: TonB-dependent receptor [Victivallales bacterium]|nr:TonB-dependent receptor [Victivallales bacterium]